MTTSTETELPPEEVETVGSAVVSRRIYAYTLPGKDAQPWERTVGGTHSSGTGLIKVGDTTKAEVLQRIKQQLGTAYPHLEGVTLLLDTEAQRNDGTAFRDHDVHRALVAKGIRKDAEWFEATVDEVQAAIVAVRNGQSYDGTRTADFGMRPEQEEAVAQTAGYYRSHAEDGHAPRFLWNAKMRFGKTFTTYQLAREMGWKRVLVLTYKPVVQTAWKEDLLTHVDFEGWRFVDRESSPEDRDAAADSADPVVWFASFQDMRGKTADGNIKEHNEVIHLIDWDAIVLDEYHFGAWRDSARELYDPTEAEIAEAEEPDESVTEDDLGLTSRHYLYLSGTPFRAITNGEFTEDQIFNWTYVDEQREKEHWDAAAGSNPYIDLPGMQIFSYDIGGDAEKWAADGEFDGFSLNEYFKAKKLNPKSNSTAAGAYEFEDPDRVHEFLEMLRGTLPEQMKLQIVGGQKPPFPYQAPVFAQAITHSVWYLNDVAGCFAMRDALLKHPYFKTFEIVVAAGSGVGMGEEGQAAGDGRHQPRDEGRHRVDHPHLREADDRGDRPRVGRDPHAAVAEVPGNLFPGRVPGAVALVQTAPGRHRGGAQRPGVRLRVRPEPGTDPGRRVRYAPGRTRRHHPTGSHRPAAELPADLRLRRRHDDRARRRRCAQLGHHRRRRNRPGAAVELPASGQHQRADPYQAA